MKLLLSLGFKVDTMNWTQETGCQCWFCHYLLVTGWENSWAPSSSPSSSYRRPLLLQTGLFLYKRPPYYFRLGHCLSDVLTLYARSCQPHTDSGCFYSYRNKQICPDLSTGPHCPGVWPRLEFYETSSSFSLFSSNCLPLVSRFSLHHSPMMNSPVFINFINLSGFLFV